MGHGLASTGSKSTSAFATETGARMFTGIITDIGIIRSVEQKGDQRLTIGCGYDMDSVDLGASISCSGACLTVVDKGEDWFAVDVSQETVSKTAPGQWTEGGRLNLERALRVAGDNSPLGEPSPTTAGMTTSVDTDPNSRVLRPLLSRL